MCVCVRQKKLLKHSCIGTFFATNPKTPTWTIRERDTLAMKVNCVLNTLTAHASGIKGTDTSSSGFLCFRIWHWLQLHASTCSRSIVIYYKCTSSTWSSIVGIQKAGKKFFFCNARDKRFIAFKMWIVPNLCIFTANHWTFNLRWASLLTCETAESLR